MFGGIMLGGIIGMNCGMPYWAIKCGGIMFGIIMFGGCAIAPAAIQIQSNSVVSVIHSVHFGQDFGLR